MKILKTLFDFSKMSNNSKTGAAEVDQLILSLNAGSTVWVDQLKCFPILKNTPLARAHINTMLVHKLAKMCHAAFNIANRRTHGTKTTGLLLLLLLPYVGKTTGLNSWIAVVVAAAVTILRVGKSTELE